MPKHIDCFKCKHCKCTTSHFIEYVNEGQYQQGTNEDYYCDMKHNFRRFQCKDFEHYKEGEAHDPL